MRLLVAAVALSAILSSAAFGQSVTSNEIGMQASYLQLPQFGSASNIAGLGARHTLNFSRNFALDTAIDFYPTSYQNRSEISYQWGGRTLTAASGVKAGLRRQSWGIFGKVRPGLMMFTGAGNLKSGATELRTHFMVDLGGVLELYPTRRTIVRVDLGTHLVRYGQKQDCEIAAPACIIYEARIPNMRQASIGVSRRFGSVKESEPNIEREPGRFEIGGQFTYIANIKDGSWGNEVHPEEPGFGGRFGWNAKKWLALEGEANWFPRTSIFIHSQFGGRTLEGLFGGKMGIRGKRVGAFAKVRPGFVFFDRTLRDASNPSSFMTGTATHFALDTGGVFEVYPSKHTLLRFDAGNTWIRVGPRSAIYPEGLVFTDPATSRDTLQVSTGFAWRF